MTEEIGALLSLAEKHASSISTLRTFLPVLQTGRDYMSEEQLKVYKRLRSIVEEHDRKIRRSAINGKVSQPLP